MSFFLDSKHPRDDISILQGLITLVSNQGLHSKHVRDGSKNL